MRIKQLLTFSDRLQPKLPNGDGARQPSGIRSGGSLRAMLLFFIASMLMVAEVNAVTITVSPGPTPASNLNQIMENANDGDIILVNPGSYTAQATTYIPGGPFAFNFRKNLTVKSVAGPATTILQASAGAGYTVYIFPMAWGAPGPVVLHSPNGATLDGFTLTGAKGGVNVQDIQSKGIPPDNITLKNLVINSDMTTPNGSHGIYFESVTNSRIDATTITNAYANGIYIHLGSNNSLTSNVVQHTVTQHAIGISSSDNNDIIGNTITGSAFHGILLLASNGSRIVRNSISGHRFDGITLTEEPTNHNSSTHNFIGQNRIVSSGVETSGTGIWLNANSNGNMVYGNDMAGSPETGLALFVSSSNLLEANSIHDHSQGGLFLWNTQDFGVGGRPSNNLLRNNYIYHNRQGGMVILRDTLSTDVAFNFMSSLNGFGVAPDPAFPANGVVLQTSASSLVYGNVISDASISEYVYADVTNAQFYRNRHFNAIQKYSWPSATVAWDGGNLLGGNYWSDQAAVGNPSTTTPYTNFIPGGSGYADRYPFQYENFGQAYSVVVTSPRAGLVAAAGSTKTIRWDSTGCVYVDIALLNGGGSTVSTLASTYPDIGNYVWNIPSGQPSGNFSIKVICKNSAGQTTGTSAQGATFGITPNGLTLLSPVSYASPQSPAAGSMLVSWARTGAVAGGVNVYLSVDGIETQKATGVTGNYVSFAAPAGASNRAFVRIADTATTNFQDSVDGYFPLIAAIGSSGFTGIATGQNVSYGNKFKLEWKSVTGSKYVDIDLGNGTSFQSIAQNVPDFGRYDWYVLPAFIGSNLSLRLTFKSGTAGPTIGIATSNLFNIVSAPQCTLTALPTSITLGGFATLTASCNPAATSYAWTPAAGLVPGSGNTAVVTPTAIGAFQYSVAGSNSVGVGNLASAFVTVNSPCSDLLCTDLAVTQAVTTNPLNAGKDVVYQLTVSNAGPGNATGVTLIDTLPAGASFVWASPGCAKASGTVTCSIGALASGANTQLKLVVRPAAAGSITNSASVSGAQADFNSANNTSSSTVTVTASAAGVPIVRYRLYSPVTLEHHFTTSFNEYTILGASGAWNQEGPVGHVLNNPGVFNGVTAVPYYRLYNPVTRWHHWTTDANEYYTLVLIGWSGEGVDGYILPTATTGAIQLYRLVFNAIAGLHHWTIDANEYSVLTTSGAWTGEPGSGFVIQ